MRDSSPSDSSPRRFSADLAIAPSFSDAAIHAYAAMREAGVDVTTAHVVLYRLNGRTLIDTTIKFPVNSDVISLELPVDISAAEEQLDAVIELKDATGLVQFSSKQRVTARDASLPQDQPAQVTLQYVGPGYDVKSLSLSPVDAQVQPGASQDLVATGFDASGKSVSGMSVKWTNSDTAVARLVATSGATATVSPRAARGTVSVTATSASGVTATSRLTFLPQATRIVVVGGGGQTGVGGTILPNQFIVEVQGSDGKGIGGRAVVFRALTPDAGVGLETNGTGADGRAGATMKLGRTAGSYVFEASSGSLPAVTVSVNATLAPVGPPTQITPLSPLPQQIVIGQQSTSVFSAQLADANGAPVLTAGIVITATLAFSPGTTVVSLSSTTNSQGVFSFSIPVYNGPPGSVNIALSSPQIPNLPSGTFPVVTK